MNLAIKDASALRNRVSLFGGARRDPAENAYDAAKEAALALGLRLNVDNKLDVFTQPESGRGFGK